jgi:hypothetical protein
VVTHIHIKRVLRYLLPLELRPARGPLSLDTACLLSTSWGEGEFYLPARTQREPKARGHLGSPASAFRPSGAF